MSSPLENGCCRPPAPASGLGRTALLLLAWLLGFVFPVRAGEELRGLWVDTFHPGMRSEAEVRQLVSDARRAGFNALFVEVRKRGDAYYDSRLEPPASDLAPGFDPLARLLALAHDEASGRRLEVHAWVVTFNIWNQQEILPAQPDHPYRRHPEWLTRSVAGATWDGSNYAFDPGHPEVQEHTFRVVMDLVRRYDVDGLHLDYIRYAGIEWGYNPVAVERYNRAHGRTGRPSTVQPEWLQFRRDQVTGLVRRIYLTVLSEKPAVRVSAATITFAPGITTAAQWPGTAAYSAVLQDWRAWMEEGILDWSIPMTYFRQTDHPDAFASWNVFIKNHQYGRQAAIGLGTYLNSASNALAQARMTRRPTAAGGRAAGLVAYAYAAPVLDLPREEFFAALRSPSAFDPDPSPLFAEPAAVPGMPWKTNRARGHAMGLVRDARTDRSIDGAAAEFCGPMNRSLKGDASGFLGAVDLVPGEYQVTVSAPGYEPAAADVSLTGGQVASFEFALAAVGPSAPVGLRVDAGAEAAVLSWTNGPGADGEVEVEVGIYPCGAERRWRVSTAGERGSLLLTGLRPSTEHQYHLVTRGGGTDLRRFRTGLASGREEDRPDPGRVPPWWARHFGGDAGMSASADEDADGHSNAAEYLLGTDPVDPGSSLRVTWGAVSGGLWRVGFRPWVADRTYELQVWPWTPGVGRVRSTRSLAVGEAGGWERMDVEARVEDEGGGVFEVDPARFPQGGGWLRVAAQWP